MLTKEQILAADDLPVMEVPVPEWGPGETVFVRTLTAEDNEHIQAISKARDSDAIFLGRFGALLLCDAEGNRLFTDDDAPALGRKSMVALGRIMEAGQRHNGMTGDEQAATEKNSEPSQG